MKADNLTSSFMALREKLHRSAIGFLRNDEDAQDALQDTFFNLWKSGTVGSDTEARNKLFVVLRNICIDRLRRPRAVALDESEAMEVPANPVSIEDMARYESLLTSGLSVLQRRIYSLVTHKGLEYEEIAEVLEMSVESVRMNMSRARKKMRENYKKLENEGAGH